MDSKLRSEAEAIGISVDSRWSDTTLRQKIDEKKADNSAAGTSGIIPGTNDGPSKEASSGAAMTDDGSKLKTEATPKAVHSGDAVNTDEKASLIQTATELNILVDDSWDVWRLRGEIQMAREGRADLQVKGAVPPKEYGNVDYDQATKADKAGTPVILNRDYWNANGDRIAAGTKLNLNRNEAARLISEGVASRGDPLP